MNEIARPERPHPIDLEDLPSRIWSTEVRVRFGHCDPAGIVYTPEFFNIFNQVIEEWYEESLGISYYDLLGKRRTGLGYVNVGADFFSPALMGDTLRIAVCVPRVGTSSFQLRLHAFHDKAEALRGQLTVVTTDLETHRPIPIPADLKDAIAGYSGN